VNQVRILSKDDGHCPGASTQAVVAGNHVFVSGQMSLDESGLVVGSDVATQAEYILSRLQSILAEAGATMDDVVKHNVYFDCDDSEVESFLDDLDAVRVKYFHDPGPTTTEVRVGLNRRGALLLVDAWAIIGADKRPLLTTDHWSWRKKLPFSHGLKVNDIVFVGGQRSLGPSGQPVGQGDIEIQTDNAFRNLDTMLQSAGGNRNNLMRQNTYFRFSGEGRSVTEYWEKMTRVRMRYMSVPSAAGAGLRVPGISDGQELIQVEGVGVLGDDKQRLQPENHWDWSIPNTQFTQGWRIGKLAFIGGQISADNRARAVGKDLATQTRNVFQFIHSTLREGGLDERDVVKLFIYYHTPESWTEIDEATATIVNVTREFYSDPGPASTSFRVSGFAFEELLIEIEAMAVCRD
jgi:enamine deaminase RidA (YjgF/YER057c/UK114 family)